MKTLRIKRIRINAKQVKISFEELNEDNLWIHTSIESPEMPKQVFIDSLQALASDICTINEYNSSIVPEIKVTGLTFRWDKDINKYKVLLVAKRKIRLSNSPSNLITPLVSIDKLNENDEDFKYKMDLDNKIVTIIKYANLYLSGDREKSKQEKIEFKQK